MDYIACWFFKATLFIKNTNSKVAFVSTNSIHQGESIQLLWTMLIQNNMDIFFAHLPFKWQNNAKGNAGVTVTITGLSNSKEDKDKFLYFENSVSIVKNITPYLTAGRFTLVKKQSTPLSLLPMITKGSKPIDNGNLLLTDIEKKAILQETPELNKYIKKTVGSNEFINGIIRWCLWVSENEISHICSQETLIGRFEKVKLFRESSDREATKQLSAKPYQYAEIRHKNKQALIIPEVSSERRKYIPIGYTNPDTIISSMAYAIYDPEPWVFAVISSKMHNVWVRAVAGRMRTDIRYSSVLCYNTFPFPEITEAQKEALSRHTRNVIREREQHSEKTIAELYDPDKMPEDLRRIHKDLDEEVEMCYGLGRPFHNDEERLAHLFKLYEDMIATEQTPLFVTQKKQRKGKRNA
jgi:hypothetical protein